MRARPEPPCTTLMDVNKAHLSGDSLQPRSQGAEEGAEEGVSVGRYVGFAAG